MTHVLEYAHTSPQLQYEYLHIQIFITIIEFIIMLHLYIISSAPKRHLQLGKYKPPVIWNGV